MNLNPSMTVMTISKGIERIEMEAHHHHDEKGHHDEEGQSGTPLDPHIWLAPSNVQKLREQVPNHLLETIPNNSEGLRSNFLKFP